ncbi:hypothetical protein BDV59DRAFT_109786 [Aspergillus ambiguus]|uniref:uncharacterized protein n=1 Tax=Aspergillus ambiguus TaxID=176160 RepID=UPI003CCD65C9
MGQLAAFTDQIFLKNYLLGGRFIAQQFGLTQPKSWHGAPMATLRRAILALGSGGVYGMDQSVVTQLETLRRLYFLQEYLESRETNNQIGDDESPTPHRKIETPNPEVARALGHRYFIEIQSRPTRGPSQEGWTLGEWESPAASLSVLPRPCFST